MIRAAKHSCPARSARKHPKSIFVDFLLFPFRDSLRDVVWGLVAKERKKKKTIAYISFIQKKINRNNIERVMISNLNLTETLIQPLRSGSNRNVIEID